MHPSFPPPQTIARGLAFRFQDLRSIFYSVAEETPQVVVPREIYKLTRNYRTHSGILNMANSIVDLVRLRGRWHSRGPLGLVHPSQLFPLPPFLPDLPLSLPLRLFPQVHRMFPNSIDKV